MNQKTIILIAIVLVVGLPFVFQRDGEAPVRADRSLVVVSPHNEAIRAEFSRGFADWYRLTYGGDVAIDWRVPGGTSEIVRYLNAQYTNAFRNYWEGTLGRRWNANVQSAFSDPAADKISDEAAEEDPRLAERREARQAFLASNVGIGVDMFFGGGSYEFGLQAARGQLVPSPVILENPSWLSETIIPLNFAGEPMRDGAGRWIGACLSSFGIIYNRDRLKALGYDGIPDAWDDLADERFLGQVALADPTKSGSIAKAFEMIIQSAMQRRLTNALASSAITPEDERLAVAQGWLDGLRTIQLISANAKYFTDSAGKPVQDVSSGDCAVGMAIDFYGRFQEQNLTLRQAGGPKQTPRFGFIMPRGGSSLSADPIALLRGAPDPDIAGALIEYVLSMEGQQRWGFLAGSPGGPERFTLRRSPIRIDFYHDTPVEYRSDPDVNPYEEVGDFVYRAEWTGPLFSIMRMLIKAAFIDPHPELIDARSAIVRARAEGRIAAADEAEAVLMDLSTIDYAQALGPIREAMRSGALGRLKEEARLASHFRAQYQEARRIAEGR